MIEILASTKRLAASFTISYASSLARARLSVSNTITSACSDNSIRESVLARTIVLSPFFENCTPVSFAPVKSSAITPILANDCLTSNCTLI